MRLSPGHRADSGVGRRSSCHLRSIPLPLGGAGLPAPAPADGPPLPARQLGLRGTFALNASVTWYQLLRHQLPPCQETAFLLLQGQV